MPFIDQSSGNGWYWNPLEGGTGFMFEAQGNRAFVAFFMYAEATGLPIWYAAYGDFVPVGSTGGYSFSGDLRVYQGGQAVTSAAYTGPTSVSVGSVSIAFASGRAVVTLPGGRTINAQRYVIDGSGYDLTNPMSPLRTQPEVGWYWSPAEGGRGYAIEVQNGKVFMAMFHYNPDGSPTWNVAQGSMVAGTAVQSFALYSGGQSLTSGYRGPTKDDLSPFTMTFRSPCAGQMQLAGAPAITVRRFRIDGTSNPPGAECSAVSNGVFPATPGLLASGAVMEPGDTVFGKINVSGELYAFGFNLQAGRTYTVSLEGAAGAGTLLNPVIGVYNGSFVEQQAARPSPSSLSFTPASGGVYYFTARASGAETGYFVLSVGGMASNLSSSSPPGLSAYAGTIAGNLSGRATGTFTLDISSTGQATGTLVLTGNQPATLAMTGQVVSGGITTLVAGKSSLTFSGYTTPDGSLFGTWRDGQGPGGLFRGSRRSTPPPNGNTAPTAVAGPPQTVTVGVTVTLDSSLSSDPERQALAYQWTLLNQPVGSTAALAQAASAKASLVPDVAGSYLVALAVSDGQLASTPSVVVINAVAVPAVTVLAVGDIAQCQGLAPSLSAAAKTAALIGRQPADWPLLLLGDLVYNSGTLAEYRSCYDPTYGPFLARSFPAPGNHDYGVPDGADYYRYFSARAGASGRGYYSVDFGSWHIVSLNSNVPMTKGSAQDNWLRADLTAQAGRKCTLAYWHHPRYSSSDGHGDDPRSTDAWLTLLEFGADVVLVGHDHTYERFAPQNAQSQADPVRGMRQFVVGTGGAGLYGFAGAKPNSEVRGQGSFGVLKLVLDDGRYAWEFLPAAGSTFTDSGSASCVR